MDKMFVGTKKSNVLLEELDYVIESSLTDTYLAFELS
jgi:hypothetical protein